MNLSNNKVYLYLIGMLSHTTELLITGLIIAGCIIASMFEHNQVAFTTAFITIISVAVITLLLLIIKKKGH